MYKKFIALISVWARGGTIFDPTSTVMKLIQAKCPQTPSPSDYRLEVSLDAHSLLVALASQIPPIPPPDSSPSPSDSAKLSVQPPLGPNYLPSPRCRTVLVHRIRWNYEIVH